MFHKEHFCHVSSTNRGCPQYSIYVYKTTDSVETMLSAGYFNGALLDLHKNDVILAGIISEVDDGQYSTAWFRVIKRSLDAIEVEQVLTSADNITYDGTGTNYLSQFDNVQDAISALDAELKKESTERTQGQESLQGQIDGINEKIPENASASNQLATESDINTLQGQIDDNSRDIEALQGAGGALTAYNFNTATPTQETLTKYAVDQIWPGNTNWAWNAANPAASTFTDADGVARTAAEIFNSTWVNNTYDDHRWQLTNTQNTAPKVFEWADVGRDIVSVATATTAGIVRVGDGSQMVVNASTGDISLDGSKAESIRGTIGAVASNQGSSNSGLILGIDADGDVVPTESSSGGRNIGDIFWTTRTDSALNGAVEANGAQYNFADVNQGQNNVQALLVSGALPSVTITEFDAKVASDGGCDSFGYDSSATYFKVPKKTPRILVRCQKLTADNNYTWYNLYADGWVEQGGIQSGNTTIINGREGSLGTISLPIEMLDTSYVAISQCEDLYCIPMGTDKTNTTTKFIFGAYAGNKTLSNISWQVSGYATPAEYTKDKWDYQNVQVERPMVQLFSSATDEAVATCASVLQDVANLNMGDYVIYWDGGDASDHSHAKPGVATPASGTWYRLYKSGRVEQGGTVGNPNNGCILVTLPISMSNTSFTALASGNTSGDAANYNGVTCERKSSTQIAICTTGQQGNGCSWRVDGYAA